MSATSMTRGLIIAAVLTVTAWGARTQASHPAVQNAQQPATGSQQTPPTPGQATTGSDQTRANGSDVVLLQRIEDILTKATANDGDLKSAGKVTMSRSDVAEILALVRELKVKQR